MEELWSTLDDHELDVIIDFVRRNNVAVADINARMRAQPPPGAGEGSL